MSRRARDYYTVAIAPVKTHGVCRWCKCTERDPCDCGCGWADRDQTLCTACVPLDDAMKTVAGRKRLAIFLQDIGGF